MSSASVYQQPRSLLFPAIFERIRPVLPPDISIFLVGGAVRDLLLGRDIHDLDFTVAGNALTIARSVANNLGAAFYVMHDEFEIGRVIYYKDENLVYTLDFSKLRGSSLESDLIARDFTINALAIDVKKPDQVIDLLGGISDLRNKTIRVCSDSAFCDDPVRILRAVRQSTSFGFGIQKETIPLIQQSIHKLVDVSPERLRDEFLRILAGPHPAVAIRVLNTLGIISNLFPELETMKGVNQSPPHINDVWEHTLAVLVQLDALLDTFIPDYVLNPEIGYSLNLPFALAVLKLGPYRKNIYDHLQLKKGVNPPLRPILFFAALYHDTGKPAACCEDSLGRKRFFDHESISSKIAGQRGHAFHLSNEDISRLQKIVQYHMRPLLLSQTGQVPSRKAVYRFFRDSDEIGIDICLLSLADYLATYGHTLNIDGWVHLLDVVTELMKAWWDEHETQVAPPPLISGRDLIQTFSLSPGPQIGDLLAKVREAQAMGVIAIRADALEFVNQILKSPVTPG